MVSQFGLLGYTIMGKTADLTVVQKTMIDTLHKEGKPQTFIAKEAGCSQSAVSKHVNRKLSGRKKCGRKRCTTNRENRSLERLVKQNRFKNLDNFRGILPGLRRRNGLLPRGPKSSFQMRVSFVFHLETKVLESGGRVEKLIAQEVLEHFMPPSADQLFKDFIFQQDVAPAHTAKSNKSCLNDHGVGVFDWPANSPELNPTENLWGIVKRKMRNKRPKMQMS
ncbi:Transposable element Tcb2 transposase [Labeo rohita]|uniref:Transposable element Tcb2 transposase n=1 Tax=Labeo rohita TaxID=84645 RepID=A0ABQ8MJR1_LABRO|nr:Transposable element Tcb2 transposase [Labeo rohita]